MRKVFRFIIVIIFIFSLSGIYAESDRDIDMTGGRSESGIRIDSIDPPMMPVISSSFNSLTFWGDINAYIDSSTIQMYAIDGEVPLLDILRHNSYGNGASIDYKYKQGFTPIVGETYRFRFKHLNTGDWMVYYIKATDKPMLKITEDLTSGTVQLGYVGIDNASIRNLEDTFEEMYLVDENGNNVATGEIVMIDGQLNLTLNSKLPLERGGRYYVRSTNKDIIITYSNFLNRNYLIVSDEPKVQMINSDLLDYSRDHNDYYLVEITGVNINPDELEQISFEYDDPFTDNDMIHTDVMTNEMVEIDYRVDLEGVEILTLKVDKNYLKPAVYSIYMKKLNKKYDTDLIMFCDDMDKYSFYSKGNEPIYYEQEFFPDRNKFLLEGTDMGVNVITFDKQSIVNLDISRYSDPRGSYSTYEKSIKVPTFENSDLMTYSVSSDILNIKQNDYRKTQTIEITMDLNSENLSSTGIYTFYHYDYPLNKWIPQKTYVDTERNVISMETTQLGQFIVVNYQKSFYDIKKHWARANLEDMASEGMISGSDGMFRPDESTTRAEFVTMVVKSLNLEQENVILPYSDLSKTHWSYRFIMTAYKNGLITKSDTFNPSEVMTRVEMASIIARAYKLNAEFVENNSELSFTDCDELDENMINDINLIKQLNIINGRSNEIFAPLEPATRAEAMVILKKLIDKIK